MNIGEEQLIFTSELGKAMAQWSYAEQQLLNLVQQCVAHSQRAPIAEAYLAIENFRSKLSFCDRLVQSSGRNDHVRQYWKDTLAECRALATKRNQLAHGWHDLYVHQPTGKRFAISRVVDKSGKLQHRQGERAPPGTLYVRDIALYRMEFKRLTTLICNLVELQARDWMPFPAAHTEKPVAPTLRMLEERFRIGVGRKPRPPRGNMDEQAGPSIEPPSVQDTPDVA